MSVALVTGASRGIGAACAIALAEAGFDVGIGYVTDHAGAVTTAEAVVARGRAAEVVQGDLSDPNAAQTVVTRTEDALGPLDALVLNAGITRDGLMMRMSDDDWRDVMDTNLSGAFWTARAALRGMMKRRRGSIVAVSSVVGIRGNAGQVNYAAAKAGLIGMTKALAKEAGSRGVRANAVAPGYIITDMTSALPEAVRDQLIGNTPLGRLGTPDDVAAIVAFLCSDAAAFITGTVIPVDGGLAA
ncbi:MAG: 3-oxoacyl-[acyl-carrier-protein] reductase [Thermoleophilia bacterium]|nr:3-oxoacyl-[acyl-carrier-protein] reductase [Thermoleophilia bacterium]